MKTIEITKSAFVKVSEHSNGFYTQLIYNNGESAGKIFIYQSEKQALKKAEKIKNEY